MFDSTVGMFTPCIGGAGFESWLSSQLQLPADVHPRRLCVVPHICESVPSTWETSLSFQLLVLVWSAPVCCACLGSEPVDERALSVCRSHNVSIKKEKKSESGEDTRRSFVGAVPSGNGLDFS